MLYSDIINNGLILPEKAKYTKRDYNRLLKAGYTWNRARFIVICSHIYHHGAENVTGISQAIYKIGQ